MSISSMLIEIINILKAYTHLVDFILVSLAISFAISFVSRVMRAVDGVSSSSSKKSYDDEMSIYDDKPKRDERIITPPSSGLSIDDILSGDGELDFERVYHAKKN